MTRPDVPGAGGSDGGPLLNELLLPIPVVTLESVLGLSALLLCACSGAGIVTAIATAN